MNAADGRRKAAEKLLGKGWKLRALRAGGVLIALYFAVAYIALPLVWTHYEHHPGLSKMPMRTSTAQGIPGDPINIGVAGSRDSLLRAFQKAGWTPADPITLRSSLEIAESVVLHRADDRAPVSPLFYDGRKQDFAFERQVGGSADQRHHIRFWRTDVAGSGERPIWLASATFDRGVGLSRYTGQITHHIAPDVDTERDFVITDLMRAHVVSQTYEVTGSGPTLLSRNGEGDPFFTDGEVKVAVLVNEPAQPAGEPDMKPPPVYIARKRTLFDAYRAISHWFY